MLSKSASTSRQLGLLTTMQGRRLYVALLEDSVLPRSLLPLSQSMSPSLSRHSERKFSTSNKESPISNSNKSIEKQTPNTTKTESEKVYAAPSRTLGQRIEDLGDRIRDSFRPKRQLARIFGRLEYLEPMDGFVFYQADEKALKKFRNSMVFPSSMIVTSLTMLSAVNWPTEAMMMWLLASKH